MPNHKTSNQVAILDAGAQYTKLIDKMVRSLNIESVILPLTTTAADLEKFGAVIISGGPGSVYSEDAPEYHPDLFTINKPILGICYGLQMMNYDAGGTVAKKDIREDGQFEIKIKNDSPLFQGLEAKEQVLLTHGDSLDQVASAYEVIAESGEIIAGIQNLEKKYFGVQFHPEVGRLTPGGRKIFENFLFKIAELQPDFSLQQREQEIFEEIRQSVGDKKVIVLVSGGVDSTVCAALMTKALQPEQIEAFHIDTGLMRQNESDLVKESLGKIGLNIHLIRARDDFLEGTTEIDGRPTEKLSETTSPEVKRKIIGDTYIKVIDREVGKLGLKFEDTVLVQGTLRPDLIESASKTVSKTAETIKTHHNDTALVRQLRDAGRVIEPLKDLHKDEVRQLGKDLGLPEELVWRQPFPGPGLAVRVICSKVPPRPPLEGGGRGESAFAREVLGLAKPVDLSEGTLDQTGKFQFNGQLVQRAQEMSRNLTEAESIIWEEILRSKKTGYKFVKQKIVNQFILDFYCSELLLGIEIDGVQHQNEYNQEYDKYRDEIIKTYGIKLIRIPAKEVYNELDSVAKKINKAIQERNEELQSTKTPPYLGGRGGTSEELNLLPIQTVGVQGDGRSYKKPIALFEDNPDWEKLAKLAMEIPKSQHDVNRVVYVFGKYQENAEYGLTETSLNNEALDQLRAADAIVNEVLIREKLTKIIAQMPVILTPVDFGEVGKRSVVLRPILTDDFMTGTPALPGREISEAVLEEIVQRILEVPGIARVMYDLTPKPPGTVEWE